MFYCCEQIERANFPYMPPACTCAVDFARFPLDNNVSTACSQPLKMKFTSLPPPLMQSKTHEEFEVWPSDLIWLGSLQCCSLIYLFCVCVYIGGCYSPPQHVWCTYLDVAGSIVLLCRRTSTWPIFVFFFLMHSDRHNRREDPAEASS